MDDQRKSFIQFWSKYLRCVSFVSIWLEDAIATSVPALMNQAIGSEGEYRNVPGRVIVIGVVPQLNVI